MFDLMNAYYELTTPTDYAFDKMDELSATHRIEREIKSSLQQTHLQHATQLLLAATSNMQKVNPYDFVFSNLRCRIQALPPDQLTYELVLRHINNTCHSGSRTRSLVVKNVFEVASPIK